MKGFALFMQILLCVLIISGALYTKYRVNQRNLEVICTSSTIDSSYAGDSRAFSNNITLSDLAENIIKKGIKA